MNNEQTPRKTARLIYADSETSADMLYAVGIMLPDPFIWIEIDDYPSVVVSDLEAARMRSALGEEANVYTTKETARQYDLQEKPPPRAEAIIPAITEHAAVTELEVPEDFPVGLAYKLNRAGLKISPVSPFFPEREQKNAHEIEFIRKAVRMAESGMQQAVAALRNADIDSDGALVWQEAPLTSEILQGIINAAIAREGGTAAHTIAAAGIRSAFPHDEGNGEIHANEPIVIDIFPRSNRTGYYGDLTRTFVKGTPPPIVAQAFEAVNEAKAAAKTEIAPERPAAAAHNAAADVLSAHGFTTSTSAESGPSGFIHSLGHGLGLNLHEWPRVSNAGETVLQPGHVMTVEPGLYYPEWGGVRLEDVVAVTENGYENLTRIPVFLAIA